MPATSDSLDCKLFKPWPPDQYWSPKGGSKFNILYQFSMENVLKAFPQELQRYDLWAFPDTTDSKLFKFKVNFSPFHLHLQNHRANFNQTEHKALLGEGDMGLFQWRVMPSLKGDKFNCMPWIFFSKIFL